jgi:hypothetical protein
MRIVAEDEREAALLRQSLRGLFHLLGTSARITLEDEAGRRTDGRQLLDTLARLEWLAGVRP